MKQVSLDYTEGFSCLAGSCPDTCCKDWEIILDEDAISRYQKMPGVLGEQVRAAMLTENGETRARRCGALKTAIVRCCAKTDSVQFNVLMARRRSAARAGRTRAFMRNMARRGS